MADEMVEVNVPYGQESYLVKLPQKNFAGTLRVNDVELKKTEEETLNDALKRPVNSKSFSDFLSDASDVLVIVNDATRPTPTSRILDTVAPYFDGINAKFIVATGIHRAPTDEEMEFIFGKHLDKVRKNIHIHDSKDDEQLQHIGVSKNGTEMYLNKLALEAQKIVIIGSVEPHYFAGYTGGRKAFLPGIAGFQTIEMNHKHALKMEAQALELDGNPVHDDMVDALGSLKDKEIFSIQVVLDQKHQVYGATAGELNESFNEAVQSAWDVFCVKITEKADIVVSVAPYPMDVDLYQSQKALDNGKLALKRHGILIMVSKCRTGVGHDSFLQLMSAAASPLEAIEVIKKDYKVGYHKAAKMAEIAVWAEMWGVTDLDSDTLQSAFIRSVDSIQAAVDEAIEVKGPDAKVLFMLDGSITVPLLEQ
jgi:nickel-dependent lactate racemase